MSRQIAAASRDNAPQPLSPEARRPVLALFGLLLLLAITHLYTQAAHPLHGMMIGAGMLLVALLAVAGAAGTKLPRGRLVWVALALAAAWPLWWAVRQMAAPVPAFSRATLATQVQGAVVFFAVVAAFLAWPKERAASAHLAPERVVALFVAGLAVALALFGIYQALGPASLPKTFAASREMLLQNADAFDPILLGGLLHALEEGRASATFGNSNVYAGFLALAVPLVLLEATLAARQGRRRAVVVWIVGLGVMATALILSGSRGGVAAAGLGAALFGAGTWQQRKRLPATAALAALLLLPVRAVAAPVIRRRRWLSLGTLGQRMAYWTTAWTIWSGSFLLGAGPGAYEVFYAQHRLPGAQETRLAHSWIFHWGAEVGLVGLLLFAGWVVTAAALALRAWRRGTLEPERTLAGFAFLAALAAALAHGLLEFTYAFRETYLDWAVLLGVLAGLGLTGLGLTGEGAPRAEKRLPVLPLAAGLGLLAAGAVWWTCQMRPAMAVQAREEALALVSEGAPPLDEAEAWMEALAWQPDHPEYAEGASRAFLRAGDGDAARAYLARALGANPHSAHLHQALAYLESVQNPALALELQRRAVDLHPLDPTHHWALAELLWRAGDREEARRVFAEARELKVFSQGEWKEFERVAAVLGVEGRREPAAP